MSDALSELTGTLRRRTTKDDLRWGSKVTWGYQPAPGLQDADGLEQRAARGGLSMWEIQWCFFQIF